MNPRTVITLWIIVAVLAAAVATVKLTQSSGQTDATDRAPGQTLFTSFPADEAASINIQGADSAVTLVKTDGVWTVSERDGYPANSRNVNDLIRTLADLKVTQGIEAGPSFAPRFGMDPSASKAEERGLTATFKDSAGKEIATVSFGKNLDSAAASASPFGGGSSGRYVRNHADESGFYAVSELFGNLSDDPKSWLAEDFVKLEKIKSITLTKPGSDEVDWSLTREDESAEFKLADAAESEGLDNAATAPLKSLFSFSRFDDVVPAAEVAARATPDQLRKATVVTFEGFNYTFSIQPAKPSAAPEKTDAEAEPPAADNYLLSFEVAADLPKERKKAEGETEEQAKTADQIFTERLDTLSTRLEKERKLAGRTFEVSKFTVEALLKSRDALLSKGPAPAANVPPPSPGTTAYTPPIEIPALPKAEEEEQPEDPAEPAEPADPEEPEKAEEEIMEIPEPDLPEAELPE